MCLQISGVTWTVCCKEHKGNVVEWNNCIWLREHQLTGKCYNCLKELRSKVNPQTKICNKHSHKHSQPTTPTEYRVKMYLSSTIQENCCQSVRTLNPGPFFFCWVQWMALTWKRLSTLVSLQISHCQCRQHTVDTKDKRVASKTMGSWGQMRCMNCIPQTPLHVYQLQWKKLVTFILMTCFNY